MIEFCLYLKITNHILKPIKVDYFKSSYISYFEHLYSYNYFCKTTSKWQYGLEALYTSPFDGLSFVTSHQKTHKKTEKKLKILQFKTPVRLSFRNFKPQVKIYPISCASQSKLDQQYEFGYPKTSVKNYAMINQNVNPITFSQKSDCSNLPTLPSVSDSQNTLSPLTILQQKLFKLHYFKFIINTIACFG